MHGLIQDLEQGFVRSVVFIVPSTASWPLPLYELALMSADRAWEMGGSAEFTLLTPERSPLAIFGEAASSSVARMLDAAGVKVITGSHAEVPARGTVRLRPGGTTITADRIVTLPDIGGPAIAGLPHDRAGFLAVDRLGRVAGVEDVYAAGDATDFPIKQGGIACQQADAAAEAIAAAAGAPIEPAPFSPVVRGVLVTEHERRFMERDASGTGGDRASVGTPPLWWPPTKIAGRYLAPYVYEREPAAKPGPAPEGFVDLEVPLDNAAPVVR
jgi:sulfide:quinone oxidoreductase